MVISVLKLHSLNEICSVVKAQLFAFHFAVPLLLDLAVEMRFPISLISKQGFLIASQGCRGTLAGHRI